jgi:hypothetical protein
LTCPPKRVKSTPISQALVRGNDRGPPFIAAGDHLAVNADDATRKRASKIVGSTTTSYAYDVNLSRPVVLTDGTLKYVLGNGLAYATNTSGAVRSVYHTDGLGSVRAITDANGNFIQIHQTDDLGAPTLTRRTNTQPSPYTQGGGSTRLALSPWARAASSRGQNEPFPNLTRL